MIKKHDRTMREYRNTRFRTIELEKSTIDDQHEMRGIGEMYNKKTGRKSTDRGEEHRDKQAYQQENVVEHLKVYQRKLRIREGQYQILRQVIGETTVRRILKNLVLPNPMPEAVSRSGSLSERLIDVEHRMQQIETDHSIGVERLNTMKDEEKDLSKDVDSLEHDFISLQKDLLNSQKERQEYYNIFNNIQNNTIKNEKDIKSELRRIVEIQFGEKQTLLGKMAKLKRKNNALQENLCTLQDEPEGDDESILKLIEQNKAFRMQIATLEMTSSELRCLLSEEYQRSEKYSNFNEVIREKDELLHLVDKLQSRIRSYEKLKRSINQDERITDLQNRIEQLVSEKITVEAKYKKIKEHLDSSKQKTSFNDAKHCGHVQDSIGEIMRMRHSIEKLQEENEYFKNENIDLEKELADLNNRLQSVQKDNLTLSQERVKDHEFKLNNNENRISNNELLKLETKLENIESKLETERKLRVLDNDKLQAVQKKMEEEKDLIKMLEEKLNNEGIKVKNVEIEKEVLEKTVKNLTESLSKVEALREKEIELNKTLEGDVVKIKSENRLLTRQNCKLEEENNSFRNNIEKHEDLKEELCLLMEKKIELDNNLTDFMRSREKVDAKNSHLTAELQSDISDLHNCVYHASTEVRDFISRGGTLSMNLNEGSGELEDLRKSNNQLEQVIAEMSGSIHQMAEEINRYKNDKSELEKSHNELLKKIEHLEENNNSLLVKLTNEEDNKRKEKNYIEKIEHELNTIKREKSNIYRQLQHAQELSSTKGEELLELRKTHDKIKDDLKDYQEQIEKAKSEISNKEEEFSLLKSSFKEIEKEHKFLKIRANEDCNIKKKLNELLNDRQKEIDQLVSNKLNIEFKLIDIEGQNEILTRKVKQFMSDDKRFNKLNNKNVTQKISCCTFHEADNLNFTEAMKGNDQIPISEASENFKLKEEVNDLKEGEDILNPINNDVIVNSKGCLKVESEKEERLMASTSCDDINTKSKDVEDGFSITVAGRKLSEISQKALRSF
ncbi:DgyrCDS5670 [Dimorphilus gyrociliatus]|uniref:DgyrCDS5670 n=1 Tax=Dimorphilus gyrociliatus TaxID=2664684 RepID=A0A7I8VMW8_9ANNE|nr:DgyrCDS5670 [Dimorphilus gyrociliatus]